MGGNRPSKVEETMKPVTTGINVIGTVLLFVPGGQPFGIGMLVGSSAGLAITQFIEGENEHAVKNLALGGLAAMPVMGEIARGCNAGVKTIETLGTVGRYTSIAGNTAVSTARTVDAIEKKDVRGAIVNIAGIGLGIGSGAGVSIGGLDGEKVINTTNLVVNGVYAVDATIQTGKNIDRMVKGEDVDWCDTINSTCTLVSSAKMVHDSAKKLNQNKAINRKPNDQMSENLKNAKVIDDNWEYVKEYRGDVVFFNEKSGLYMKIVNSWEKVIGFAMAAQDDTGVKCRYASFNDGKYAGKYAIIMEGGVPIEKAIKGGITTKNSVLNQLNQLENTMQNLKRSHGDIKANNMTVLSDGKVRLIDNGDYKTTVLYNPDSERFSDVKSIVKYNYK